MCFLSQWWKQKSKARMTHGNHFPWSRNIFGQRCNGLWKITGVCPNAIVARPGDDALWGAPRFTPVTTFVSKSISEHGITVVVPLRLFCRMAANTRDKWHVSVSLANIQHATTTETHMGALLRSSVPFNQSHIVVEKGWMSYCNWCELLSRFFCRLQL